MGNNGIGLPFQESREDGALISLHLTSDQEGWASALSSFYRWDGKTWVEYLSKANNRLFFTLYDMSALSQTDVWAVGTNADYNTGVRRGDYPLGWGGMEKVFTTQYDLVNIRMFSPDMGWAIGFFKNPQNLREQKSVLWYWNGSNSVPRVPTSTRSWQMDEMCWQIIASIAWHFLSGKSGLHRCHIRYQFHPVLLQAG